MRDRAARAEDAPALLELACAVDTHLWGQAETELDDVTTTLSSVDLAAATRIVEQDGRLVGSAVVRPDAATDILLAPDLPLPTAGAVADQLLGHALAAGGQEFDRAAQDVRLAAAFDRAGLRHLWSSFELERPPTALPRSPLPAGLTVRPFASDRDATAVHAAIYSVWTQVPGHHDRAFDEWRRLFIEPTRAPDELQIVVWDDEAVAGAALCRTYPPNSGWVSQLAVTERHRGRGLGRWLLTEAFHRLAAIDGLTELGLSVQAENRRALHLYRSVGLEVAREWVTAGPAAQHRQPQTERSSE